MAQPRKGAHGRTLIVIAAVGCLVAGLIGWEYRPAWRGGFIYEDARVHDGCVSAPVNGPIKPPRAIERASALLAGRPALMATWCAQLGHPLWAWHAVNLGLHLAVTGLVGALLWIVTQDATAAILASAFFGLNAVNVEAVAYLSGRSELLAALGVLGACLAALTRRWWLIAPLILLGIWGKESAAVAIVLVPLCLWYRRGRWAWAVAAGAGLLGAALLERTATWWPHGMGRGAWALLQTTGIVRVALLAILPFGQTIDYDYARVPLALQLWAVVLVLAGLIWVAWHRSRLCVFGAAWLVCAAAPRLLVPTPRSVFPEHQFYLPLVGLAIVLAGLLTADRDAIGAPA